MVVGLLDPWVNVKVFLFHFLFFQFFGKKTLENKLELIQHLGVKFKTVLSKISFPELRQKVLNNSKIIVKILKI